MDPDKIRKLRAYCDALLEAIDIADESGPSQQDPQDVLDDWRTDSSNRVLGGSGFKAEIIGGYATAPTVTSADLEALGVSKSVAAEMIVERDRVRTEAIRRRDAIGDPPTTGEFNPAAAPEER